MRITLAMLVVGGATVGVPAQAHTVAGARVFPVPLTFDDPGVGDEATLPQVTWQRSAGPSEDTQVQWEFDKTITATTAININQGFDVLHQSGARTRNGFENVVVTGKWQLYVNDAHEFVASLGVIREFAGNKATQDVGGDVFGSTAPTLYVGKGLGDLPIGVLRPLAVTGELGYVLADRKLNAAGDNGGSPNTWSGAVSLQYSLAYLQTQVVDLGLPRMIGRMVPIIEADWSTPAAGPAPGNPTQLTIGAGIIYLGDTFQLGLEALIPGNRASGQTVGVTAQLHVFFDDLFPNSLGKPLFD